MNVDKISIKGAKEHNLKDIDVEIPRDKLVVITGLSGSGKSSLAFDTIYAEGQRRYVESLSAYARQFLGQMNKPDVEYINGLSPAISIDQKTTSRNPRSTVGTVTEIYDYLRLLYARIGTPHCYICGEEISQQTVDQMVDEIMKLEENTKFQILAPIVKGRKGEHIKLIQDMRKAGFARLRVDSQVIDINEDISIDKNKKHSIEVVVDRLVIKPNINKRLADSIETALHLSSGILLIDVLGSKEIMFNQNLSCPNCGISIEELTPRMFSFNSPFGACPTCSGLGTIMKIDPSLVIPDDSKSLQEGAIIAAGWNAGYSQLLIRALSNRYKFSLDTPFKQLPQNIKDILLYGTKGEKLLISYKKEFGNSTFMTPFEGVITTLERRYRETQSPHMKQYYEGLMGNSSCPDCHGDRLKRESLAVKINDLNIIELSNMPIGDTKDFINNLHLSNSQKLIADQILKELNARLGFLLDVGLDYLSLSRASGTLSGGEAQRIRLATQIGSGLIGVLYILDEPSIGLHQRDNEKLLSTLKRLRDLGNTLIVVEHDEETMYAADYIIDMGPGAGEHGGEIVALGTVNQIKDNPLSLTGQYLSGNKKIPAPNKRRSGNGKWIEIKGAKENNLKNIDVKIPLGTITCITGVSGSGKSSLINGILHKKLSYLLNGAKSIAGLHDTIFGVEHLDKVIAIDQSPIGRTPRSNPATYTGVFEHIRRVFANTTESKVRGYSTGRFSFNVKGGRCEACTGDGIIRIEMHFLPDVYVPCEVCKGKRYSRETLDVKYKDKSIADVLNMNVETALEFFKNIPNIKNKLQTLFDVGLGYIKIGQSSTTLSGGEAQRIKLATELSKRSTGNTLYILDEPTTGLHIADVHKLIEVLERLVKSGNTVVIIEHNLDVIKTADYIIDLGPEGGNNGGFIVAEGSPEEISLNKSSYTGTFLKNIINRS